MLGEIATLLGFVIDSLAFLTAGFGIGRWYAGRRRRVTETAEAISLATAALSQIRLTQCTVSPLEARHGEYFTITYKVNSACPVPVTVWLGADCWPYYDTTQDKEVVIQPGEHEYRRSLTVGPAWPAGRHQLGAGIWLGTISMPEHSLRLQARTPAADIDVVP